MLYGTAYRRPSHAKPADSTAQYVLLIFIAAFIAAIALRLVLLATSPAWQWDEIVYWRVSANVQHGSLTEHSVYGLPWQPFLYQPPMFFQVEARWFDLVGASVYHARLLGVACTALMQALLFALLRRLHGPRVALMAVIPVLFDGWLLYIERVSYIENALMILVVLGFLLYAQALETPSRWRWRFAAAGVVLGGTACFKQTGAYVVVAALVCWLIRRRQHKEHLVLLGAAIAVIAAYLLAMIVKYDAPGNPWYIDQSMVQVRRVLGLQHSGGTLTSPAGALHLLVQQYKYFVPSLALAVCALALAVRRSWRCVRGRTWAPVRDNAVLYSWFVTGVVVFGVSSLKFPQYFVLILLPAYCYLWTEVARGDLREAWRKALPGAAAVVGVACFGLTIPAFSGNSLAEVQAYAARQIPGKAIVVTEQSIGDLIQQRWCTVEKADACVGHATYAITWQTYLQSSFTEGNTSFGKLMRGATEVTWFGGAAGTATVWKLRRLSSSSSREWSSPSPPSPRSRAARLARSRRRTPAGGPVRRRRAAPARPRPGARHRAGAQRRPRARRWRTAPAAGPPGDPVARTDPGQPGDRGQPGDPEARGPVVPDPGPRADPGRPGLLRS